MIVPIIAPVGQIYAQTKFNVPYETIDAFFASRLKLCWVYSSGRKYFSEHGRTSSQRARSFSQRIVVQILVNNIHVKEELYEIACFISLFN